MKMYLRKDFFVIKISTNESFFGSLNFPPQFENISQHAHSFLCYLTLPCMKLDSAHSSDRLDKVT